MFYTIHQVIRQVNVQKLPWYAARRRLVYFPSREQLHRHGLDAGARRRASICRQLLRPARLFSHLCCRRLSLPTAEMAKPNPRKWAYSASQYLSQK